MTKYVIRDVELDGASGVDVAIQDGIVTDIGNRLLASDSDVIDGHGGALIPGLTDHHLHLHATAADAASVRCGPPSVRTSEDLSRALNRAPRETGGWIRGVGYIETVAGELDCAGLDFLHRERPTRIQHRSGAMWMLNSRAAEAVGLATADHPGIERKDDGTPTGRLWRADDWLRERLPGNGPPDLSAVGRSLANLGVTRLTDATPDLPSSSIGSILDAVRTGALPQRVHLLGIPIGESIDEKLVSVGPYKIVLADSDPPDLAALAALIDRLHRIGRPFAAHCVSRENLLILLAALDEVGAAPGDRVEHGALIPHESIAELQRHELTVVTQPGFLSDRGDDYLRDVDHRDQSDLYRCRSLLNAQVPLALSSDAPYGPLDPWANIASAVDRRTRAGRVVGESETITAAQALASLLTSSTDPGGRPRTVRVGGPADLVLLHAPLTDVLRNPSADAVRITLTASAVD